MSDDRDDDDADYKVGYKRPPRATRFKKGQKSACPDGGWSKRRRARAEKEADARARSEAGWDNMMNEALQAIVVVGEGKDAVFRTKLDVVMHVIIRQALKGDPKALASVERTLKRLEAARTAQKQNRVGVVVLREPARSNEELQNIAARFSLPEDPFEGLPGISREMLRDLDKQEDDDDEDK